MRIEDVQVGEAYFHGQRRVKFTVDRIDKDGTIHGHLHRGEKITAKADHLPWAWSVHKRTEAQRAKSRKLWFQERDNNRVRFELIQSALADAGVMVRGSADGQQINLRLTPQSADQLLDLLHRITADGTSDPLAEVLAAAAPAAS